MSSTISITYKLQGDAKTFKELTNQADGLKKAFAGVTVEAEQLPKKMGGLKSLTSGLVKSLGGLAAGVVSVRALTKALSGAFNTIKDFESANSELAAVLGKSVKEIEGLSQSAMDLGKSTSFTASEVTALQTSLARLGFDDGQIVAMQESVLKFAAAVGTDLASAADFSGASLRAFGMKASETKPLLDMMAAACSKSALSFSKLQTSISVVGPVANAFGLSARDTVAMLGVMSNAGFDASSAATALRNILLNLADSNGKLAKGLGHTAKTMPEIIAALKELNDRGVDLNATLEMTDKKSVAAFNALLAGAGSVEELYEALGDANGSLDQMYNTMTNNLAGAIKQVGSAWQNLTLQFRESSGWMTAGLQRFARGLNVVANEMTGMSKHDARTAVLADAFIGTGTLKTLEEYDAAIDRINAKERKTAKDRRNLEVLQAARNKVWLDQTSAAIAAIGEEDDALSGLTGSANAAGNAAGAGKSKVKTLTDAINDYRKSVASAAEVNRVFGSSTNAVDASLAAMRSSIDALAAKYGPESDAVKALSTDYAKLLEARKSASDYKDFAPAMEGRLKGMKDDVSALVGEYRAQAQAVRDVKIQYDALSQVRASAKNEDVAPEMEKRLKGVGSAIDALVAKYGAENEAVRGLSDAYDALSRAVKDVPSIAPEIADVDVKVPDVNVEVPDVKVTPPDVEVSIPDVDVPVPDMSAALAAMDAALAAMGSGIDALNGKIQSEADAVNGLASSYESLLKASTSDSARIAVLSELDAQLKAMESGINSLISKYGAESDQVRSLIDDYYELLRVRRENSKSFDLVSVPTLTGPGASVQGDTAKKKGYVPGIAGIDAYNKKVSDSVSLTESLQTTIGALSGTFRSLAGAVGESAAAWLEWGSNLMSAIAQALPQLTALFVKQNAAATANTAAAASGGASAVASIPYVGPVLAVAAVASILAALASLPKFAKGGVITGPTMGLMGEYHGAVNNPEVIAPLNTLRQYIEPAGIGGHVDFRIRGRDLEGVLRTEERRTSRS